MRLVEVKNDIAKILYSPETNHILPADFLLITDVNQKLISQIINIETTENPDYNLAYLRLALSIDKEDNLSLYNGYIPSKSSEILYINADEILELVQGSGETVFFGELANHPSCFVKPSVNFINDKLYIQSDRDDKTKIVVRNLIYELVNKKKKTVLIDFDGRYSNLPEVNVIKLTESFKFPLNAEGFDNIIENDLKDCSVEDKAVIQSIVLELKEYLSTLPDKFIPFTVFKDVVDNVFISNPVPGLMLFRNKLWRYAQNKMFAESKSDFEIINSQIKNSSPVVIDISDIDECWYKYALLTIIELIKIPCYLITSLDSIKLDKKAVISLYKKSNILPIVITSYSSNHSSILKSICANQLLCKSSEYFNEDEHYTEFLNKLNASSVILYGESTLYLPLVVELKLFHSTISEEVTESEIKKDVDKLLSSSKNLITQDSDAIYIEKQQKQDYIEDDVLDDDLDFVDEILGLDKKNVDDSKNKVEYDVFSPVNVSKDEQKTEAGLETEEEEQEQKSKTQEEQEIDAEEEDIDITVEEIEPIDSVLKSIELSQNIENQTSQKDIDITVSHNELEISSDESLSEENIHKDTPSVKNEDNQEQNIIPKDENIDEETEEDNINISVEENSEEVEIPTKKVEIEKPEIKENINTKKSSRLPVYETDTSSNFSIEDLPFKTGDIVYHPKHGRGVIEGFTNYSNKILFCQIEFENVGRRILDPRIAGITKIEE